MKVAFNLVSEISSFQDSFVLPLNDFQKRIVYAALLALGFLAVALAALLLAKRFMASTPPKVIASEPTKETKSSPETVEILPEKAPQVAAVVSPPPPELKQKGDEPAKPELKEKGAEPAKPELKEKGAEPAKTEVSAEPLPPPPTLSERAKSFEHHADEMIKAADEMLSEEIAPEKKAAVLKIKEVETEKKELMQKLQAAEKQKRLQLQADLDKTQQKISAIQVEREESTKILADLQEQVEENKLKIEQIELDIALRSIGNHEVVHQEISFKPDDMLNLPSGDSVKASAYKGTLRHDIDLDTAFKLKIYDPIPATLKKGEWLAKAEGFQFEREDVEKKGAKNIYTFKTTWKGDGQLPWIKVTTMMPNLEYHEASIINLKADITLVQKDIKHLEKNLKWEKDRIADQEADLAAYQADLVALQAKLAKT